MSLSSASCMWNSRENTNLRVSQAQQIYVKHGFSISVSPPQQHTYKVLDGGGATAARAARASMA
eukprot:5118633-Amphidinium_carterae.1